MPLFIRFHFQDELFLQVGHEDEEALIGDTCEDYQPQEPPEMDKVKPKPFKEEKTVLEKPEALICEVIPYFR